MLNTCLCFVSASDNNATTHNPHGMHNQLQSIAQNTSLLEGCVELNFNELDSGSSSSGHNHDHSSTNIETSSRRMKNTALAFLFLIGGPANVINMAVFYKQGLQDRVNLCLFSLSFADELYLIAAILVHGEQLCLQFVTEERYGPVVTFIANNNLLGFTGFCFVSFVLSAIIAIERCRCVLSPLKFQTLLRTRTMAAIIITVYVLVLGLYFLVAFRYRIGCFHDPASGIKEKTGVNGEFYQAHRNFIDYLDSFVFGGGVPVFVMVVVTSATIITTVKLRQAMTWRRAGTASSISPREMALTKMLIGNSILFIVCVFPPCLSRFVCLFMPEMNAEESNQNFFLTSLWITEVLSYINASFNIFVYYGMGSRYRETFWAMFSRKEKHEEVVSIMSTVM